MQKLVGTELYVFDLTPFEITQQTSDAEVIYVQNECIDGYKELNASLADKIKGFNQFVICVTDPWAGGVEPGPEPPTPTGHTLTFDVQGTELCRITDELDSDAGGIDNPTSPVNVEVGKYFKMFTNGYGGDHYEYYTITGVQATFVDSANSYNTYPFFYFVMPDEDVTLSVTYEEPVQTGHTIEVTKWEGVNGMRLTTELGSDAGEVDPQEFPVTNVDEGTYVKLWTTDQYLETDQYYNITGVQATFVPASQSYNTYSFFYFVMPDEDVTLSVEYEEPTYAEVEVTYDVQDTESEIEIFCAGGGSPYEGTPTPPDAMYVDDNQETVVNSWRFDTTGDHTVKFVFHSGRVSAGFMQGNGSAKSINLNGQVTQIGEAAFSNNGSLVSITSLAATPPTLEGNGDNQFDSNVPIYVSADYVTDYQTAWSNFASQIQAMQS